MPVQTLFHDDQSLIEIKASGKLTKLDYQAFVPKVEQFIQQHDKPRILFEMTDFHGWELGALWEDLKFDAKHFADVDRVAMVGDKQWEKYMATFCKPFTTAQVKFFGPGDRDAAMVWLHQSTASTSST